MSGRRLNPFAALAVLSAVAIVMTAGAPPSASALSPQVAQPPSAQSDFVPGEILVKRVDRISDRTLEPAKRRVGGRRIKSFPSLGIELWKLGPGMPVGRAVAELHKSEFGRAIEFAEPNWLFFASTLPDDPQMPELWGMLNIGQTGGTADADIDAPEAWDETSGSPTIVIGVIDSGVDYLHEDLADNIWVNPAETLNGIDDDGNGYIDDIHGWDFVSDDNDPMDDFGHGTHTAGTIGAVGNNGIGVAGVNWQVKIMPLKFLNGGGRGTTDDAVEAVLYAASFGVPITNNSWGGGHKAQALEAAIRDSDALFVAAAGNSSTSRKHYPAAYDLDNILSVAATDHNDELASFSNYGESWVDLAAPGVDILSTLPNNEYEWASGTSMASPHVAGVAGLLMAAEPTFGWVEVKNEILASVDPIDSLTGLVSTGGRLNAAQALGAPTQPPDTGPPAAIGDLAVDIAASALDTVVLTWHAPGDDGDVGTAAVYDVRYSTVEAETQDFDTATQAVGEPAPQVAGSVETFALSGLLYDLTYYFAVKTFDEMGYVSDRSNVVSATTGPKPAPESACGDGIDNDGDGKTDCDDLDCIVAGAADCDACGNHVCEPGEDCGSCPDDCLAPPPADTCGDGICQPTNSEDCYTCPSDCNGNDKGKPESRFCCGGRRYGVDCSDERCTEGPWLCEDTLPVGACCGDGQANLDLEFGWTCGIDVCGPGTAGSDPELFLISYYFDYSGASDIITLAAGSSYNMNGTPYGIPENSDVPECRVLCNGDLYAYYHDVLSGAAEGDWGEPVNLTGCQQGGPCCSYAEDWGYNVECCVVP